MINILTWKYIPAIDGIQESRSFLNRGQNLSLIPASPNPIVVSNDDASQIFVDGTATTNGDGSPGNPYNNIASALAALGTSGKHVIYVRGTVTLSASTTISTSVTGAVIERSDIFSGSLFDVTGGTTTVQNVTIDGNKINIAAKSPLISVANSGTLSVGNGAVLQNNSGVNGGAIGSTSGVVNLTGGLITGNLAHSGGAIYANGGTLTIGAVSIERNSVTTALTGATTAAGGAVYAGGGAVVTVNSEAIITNNTAVTSQTNGPAEGGAFFISDSNTTVTVNAGNISYNGVQVGTGSGGGSTAGAKGGAFYVTNSGSLTIAGGVVSYNSANWTSSSTNGSGGAIFIDTSGTATITGGVISGNQAGATGNGIYVSASNKLTLSPSGAGTVTFGVNYAIYLPNTTGAAPGQISFNIGTDLSTGVSGKIQIVFQTPNVGAVVAVAASDPIAENSWPILTNTNNVTFEDNGSNITIAGVI